jgi:deazaflavin-dependent oxidoreductase (nitroreductase family)
MSFDTHAGTRGARQPGGFAARLGNKLMAGRVRKGRAKFLGFNALVLTTVGRKSGVERATPVGWFPGPDGSRLIVASAAGAQGNPAWYYNIAAHPDQVQIEVEGRKVAVTAEQLHGTEREQAWQQITTAAPRFTKYQVKTDREIPIIRLVPQSAPEPPPTSS